MKYIRTAIHQKVELCIGDTGRGQGIRLDHLGIRSRQADRLYYLYYQVLFYRGVLPLQVFGACPVTTD